MITTDAPDMQCFTCSEMYYSGEGHPKVAMCGACWHPITATQLRILTGLCVQTNPRTGRRYVTTHRTADVTGPHFRALRTLAQRGHVSLDHAYDRVTSARRERPLVSLTLALRKTAIAAVTKWCEEHDAIAAQVPS